MKVLFIFKNGTGSVAWEVPEADREVFSFAGMCRGVRCDGFFQAAGLHIQYSEVACIALDDGAALIKAGLPPGHSWQ